MGIACIYIYIEREREREIERWMRERERERERESESEPTDACEAGTVRNPLALPGREIILGTSLAGNHRHCMGGKSYGTVTV